MDGKMGLYTRSSSSGNIWRAGFPAGQMAPPHPVLSVYLAQVGHGFRIGHIKGGPNAKLHAVVDGLGNPMASLLSAGNDHDAIHAIDPLKTLDIIGSNVLLTELLEHRLFVIIFWSKQYDKLKLKCERQGDAFHTFRLIICSYSRTYFWRMTLLVW